jgi:hypothetical protein
MDDTYTSPSPVSAEKNQKRRNRSSLAISGLLHAIFILLAGFIVALNVKHKPQASFSAEEALRPSMKPEEIKLKMKVEDLQRRSAPPRLQPRMLSMSPSELALPEIKPDPQAKDQKLKEHLTTLGMSGFGSGIGRGFGTGSGGGTSFFGLKSHGRRVAYLVDFSSSMKSSDKHKLCRRELVKSIQMLPQGTLVCLIMFSGPVFVAGMDPVSNHRNWKQSKSGWKGPMPVARWWRVSPTTVYQLTQIINRAPLTHGTDWKPPFQVAQQLEPPPDTIYFMTDGNPQVKNQPAVLSMVRSWNKRQYQKCPVNAIALKAPGSAGKYMRQLARESGGKFKVVH